MKGTILFFNGKYGFIGPDIPGPDIFFHKSDIAGKIKLEQNDRVEY
jgi:cold shock CspA family protein